GWGRMQILGIDPGIRNTGWGVITLLDGRLTHVANGVIKPDSKSPDAARLRTIATELATVIDTHHPDCAAIEEIFVARSAASALKLGMARGVAMMQCAAAGLPLRELAARRVKKSVVGTGTADKTQVAAMVTRLLAVRAVNADAADALAIAIAAGHETGDDGGAMTASNPLSTSGDAGSGLERAIAAALAREAGGGTGGRS
ncbi:MAG: crossover junction endodeoxyribonuclease RuvC, partial [Rhodobiaceae bacterium]